MKITVSSPHYRAVPDEEELDKLPPCPFCGSRHLSVMYDSVSCFTCGARGPDPTRSPRQFDNYGRNEATAKKALAATMDLWSKRHDVGAPSTQEVPPLLKPSELDTCNAYQLGEVAELLRAASTYTIKVARGGNYELLGSAAWRTADAGLMLRRAVQLLRLTGVTGVHSLTGMGARLPLATRRKTKGDAA